MNKTRILSIFLASSVMLNCTPSQAIDYKKAAIIAGATLGTLIVGKIAYDYFFALSDLEEIEYALSQCEKATQATNSVAFAYHKELAITDPMKSRRHHQWHSDKILNKLRAIITGKAARHPYYSYVKQLDTHIKTLTNHQEQLTHSKMRLFERKMRLINSPGKDQSATEIASLCTAFDKALQRTEQVIADVQEVHSALLEIRTYVTSTQEYQYEAALVRIQELEEELQREKWHQHHYDRLDTHHTYVHVHTTTQPVQCVVQQEQPKCCPAQTTENSSCPVECVQTCQTICTPCVPCKPVDNSCSPTPYKPVQAAHTTDERAQMYNGG